jgi:hypothetical protein
MLQILTKMKNSKHRSSISRRSGPSAESSELLKIAWNQIPEVPNNIVKSTSLADAQRLLARLAVKIFTETKAKSDEK